MTGKLKRRTLEIEDGSISYLCNEKKAGRPNFHLLHATGFNANTYRQILEPLSEYLNVYACDLRGHGLGTTTANPGELKSWDVYREDFYRFLNTINEPVYLMGHSVGSVVSIAGAVQRPDLVQGLILTEPLIYPDESSTLFNKSDASTDLLVAGARRRRAEFSSQHEMVENYLGKGAFKTWSRPWIEDYVAGGSRIKADNCVELACKPEWEAASFQVAELTPWNDIEKLQCPTTIVYASSGGFSTCYQEGVAKYLTIHPQTKVMPCKDASHFLPMEQPALVIEAVLNMVEACENIPLDHRKSRIKKELA